MARQLVSAISSGALKSMSKFYAQWGADSVVFSVVESSTPITGDNIAECLGNEVLGQKRSANKFVPVVVAPRFKVWSKPQFILTIGKTSFDSIVDGADKELRFAKYVLDSADAVDMNVAEYVALVELLKTKNIITAAQLAALKVQE